MGCRHTGAKEGHVLAADGNLLGVGVLLITRLGRHDVCTRRGDFGFHDIGALGAIAAKTAWTAAAVARNITDSAVAITIFLDVVATRLTLPHIIRVVAGHPNHLSGAGRISQNGTGNAVIRLSVHNMNVARVFCCDQVVLAGLLARVTVGCC